jgi:hypothetical protein
MPIVQFRVHPSVGIARMGNSAKAYYLASEFPQFMQEEFPSLRLRPNPRLHPKSFFGSDTTSASRDGVLADYKVFETNGVTAGDFKETNGKTDTILPQAARFRVFAYVYASAEAPQPYTVFEVTSAEAEIAWTVNIANKKSKKTTAPAPDENLTTTAVSLTTVGAPLTCFRIRPKAGLPNLGYAFLERDPADKAKVTGRLHVIGNEGEFVGDADPAGLWSDNWYDSAGDGPVEATIKPIAASLAAKIGITNSSDIQYLDEGQPAPQPSTLDSVKAAAAWVVIGCPDYSPDMGHFVSLWDLAVSQAVYNVEDKAVVDQPGKHKLVKPSETESYRQTDYLIHIHPHLCLFKDVRFVSGEAFGVTEGLLEQDRAHNKTPPPTGPTPSGTSDQIRRAKIEQGGMKLDARALKSDLANPKALKDPDPTKPIGDWLKLAIVERLRKPGTLYRKKRKFQTKLKDTESRPLLGMFPRKLGRRMDYDGGPNHGKFFEEPEGTYHNGSLRDYHGNLKGPGKLCGGDNAPPKLVPPATHPEGFDDKRVALLDDQYWPATAADMPLLRELAFTHLQYDNFKAWEAPDADVRARPFFKLIVPDDLAATFAPQVDVDQHFAKFLADRPTYAPSMIDTAHLGSMLGGSFLPGIEVGREGGIATNWCLFHGANSIFPDVRFKPARKSASHAIGTLTKDLAVPWTGDFNVCNETWWPTARPGAVTLDGTYQTRWMMANASLTAHLRVLVQSKDYTKEYWKHLGFVRRDGSDNFFDREQSWHEPVDISFTDSGAFETNTDTYSFPPKLIGEMAPDRLTLLAITVRRSAGDVEITSVKVGPKDAVQMVTETNGNTRVSLFAAFPDPAEEIASIVVKVTPAAENCGLAIYRATGVKTAPTSRFTIKAGALTGSLNVFANGAALAVAYTDAPATFNWAGLTEDMTFNGGGAWQQSSASSKFTAAQAGLTISATPSTAVSQVMIGASWGP